MRVYSSSTVSLRPFQRNLEVKGLLTEWEIFPNFRRFFCLIDHTFVSGSGEGRGVLFIFLSPF